LATRSPFSSLLNLFIGEGDDGDDEAMVETEEGVSDDFGVASDGNDEPAGVIADDNGDAIPDGLVAMGEESKSRTRPSDPIVAIPTNARIATTHASHISN
jgi:hypothetical protein